MVSSHSTFEVAEMALQIYLLQGDETMGSHKLVHGMAQTTTSYYQDLLLVPDKRTLFQVLKWVIDNRFPGMLVQHYVEGKPYSQREWEKFESSVHQALEEKWVTNVGENPSLNLQSKLMGESPFIPRLEILYHSIGNVTVYGIYIVNWGAAAPEARRRIQEHFQLQQVASAYWVTFELHCRKLFMESVLIDPLSTIEGLILPEKDLTSITNWMGRLRLGKPYLFGVDRPSCYYVSPYLGGGKEAAEKWYFGGPKVICARKGEDKRVRIGFHPANPVCLPGGTFGPEKRANNDYSALTGGLLFFSDPSRILGLAEQLCAHYNQLTVSK